MKMKKSLSSFVFLSLDFKYKLFFLYTECADVVNKKKIDISYENDN